MVVVWQQCHGGSGGSSEVTEEAAGRSRVKERDSNREEIATERRAERE